MSDIDRELRDLEEELHRALDPLAARPVPPRRALRSRTKLRTIAGGASAVLTVKVLTTVVVAAAAVSVAGAATSGSLNPANWGRQVEHRVTECKGELGSSQHGIGDCVSPFASQQGPATSTAAPQQGTTGGNAGGQVGGSGGAGGDSNADANSGAGGNGNAKDKDADPVIPTKTTGPPVVNPG